MTARDIEKLLEGLLILLAFVLVVAPFAALGWLWQKVSGDDDSG